MIWGVPGGAGTLRLPCRPPPETAAARPQTLTSRIMGAFTGPASSGSPGDAAEIPEVLPAGERKAAMSSLIQMEAKWALGALVLATLAGIGFPAYYIVENPLTKVAASISLSLPTQSSSEAL